MSGAVWIKAAGLAAPGLPGWEAAQPVLRGETPWRDEEPPPYQPQMLPPNERRRAPLAVRQAFRAAEDALRQAPRAAGELATVFATSDADIGIIHRISSALASEQRIVSPTEFHNSVHNAAAGYWSIAVAARGPSNTVCAHDDSFAAGLLEAAALVLTEGLDTLLVVYDVPPPHPLSSKRPVSASISAALVLGATSDGALASLRLRCSGDGDGEASGMDDAALERLRLSNPAGRALPLLRLLAQRRDGAVWLRNHEHSLLHATLSFG